MLTKPLRYACKRLAKFTKAGVLASLGFLLAYTAILMCVRGPEAYTAASSVGRPYSIERGAP